MLTNKQKDLLIFIEKRLERDGVPPSFDEMKEALNLRSKSGIHRLISALEERGFIKRLPHRARAIEITRSLEDARAAPMPHSDFELPVMGRIAAGVPIEAISEVARHVMVPGELMSGSSQHFALEVVGNSMINAGILEGDIVVLRRTDTAEDGRIVVALVDGEEATLKTLRRRDGKIVLEAANPDFPDRAFAPDRVAVQAVLTGLLRSY